MRRVALAVALTGCQAPPPPAPVHVNIADDLRTCQQAHWAPGPVPALTTPAHLRAYANAEHLARLADEAALRECAGHLADVLADIERQLAASLNAEARPTTSPLR